MKNIFTKTSGGVLLVCIQMSVSPITGHADGTVVGWGDNTYGQTNVPSGLRNVVAVAAGYYHSLALTAEGQVVCWGDNEYGQTNISNQTSDVVAVAAGFWHSLAFTAEGQVVGWGYNGYGQTTIPSGLSNVVGIAAGNTFSLALTAGGQVVGWGYNDYGQTTIPSGLSNVMAIAAGYQHSLGLTAEGRVVGWGDNGYGQTTVPSGLSNVVAIAAGYWHSLALTAEGQVVGWGYNGYGQSTIPSGLSNVVGIAAGNTFSLALTAEGQVVGWGDNSIGQTTLPGGLSNAVAIAAGAYHSLALQGDGTLAILRQPFAQSVNVGGRAAFWVGAVGATLLIYQWRKDGASILGATNSIYILTGATTNDAGNYDVIVSNGLGSAESLSAVLQVLPYGAPSTRINGRLAAGTVFAASPVTVSIDGGFTDGLIFYTLDGTTPNVSSTFYTGPFSLTNNATVVAMSLSADLVQTSVAPAVRVLIVPTYTLTTSVSGDGTVGLSPSRNSYPTNSVVTLTAYPGPAYVFDHWSGDLAGSANPSTLTMNGPRSVQAVFTPTAYPLTLTTPGGGTVTANGQGIAPNTYYPTGTGVSLAASAGSGWSFLRWEGTVTSTSNPLLLTMNQTNNVQAIFGTVVSTVVAGSGTISLNPDNPVPYGTTVTATALPTPGYSFVVWSGVASGTGSPTTFTVTNPTPVIRAVFTGPSVPAILAQPTNRIVVLSNSAALSVTASGATPLSYQWQKGTNLILGATNPTYTIASAVAADAGDYDVVVSNPFGSVTSAVAMVTVVFPPSISLDPIPQTVAAGASLTLTVLADGTAPLAYQWQNSAGLIAGETNSDLIFNPAQTNNTDAYSVVVSNPYGVVTSQVAAVFVYLPVSILAQPASLVVPASAPASFSVVALGFPAPTSYQWTHHGTNVPGATSNTFNIKHVRLSDLGNYQVLVSNGYSSTTSDVAMLTMSPTIISPFNGATPIWGRSATLSVGAIGSGELNYQWYQDGVAIDGGTNAALNFVSIQFTNAGMYSVVVSSPYGTVTNVAAQVVVSPAVYSLGFCPALTINGVVGYSYVIQSSTNLQDTNAWLTVTNLTLTQPVQLWVDTNVDASSPFTPKYFYRILPGQ